jgi:hypothetical protein
MKNSWLFLVLIFILSFACKSKKTEPKSEFFSAVSIINDEIRRVDSSLFTITKYDFIDSNRVDTTPIHREDFRKVASDFTSLPDISTGKLKSSYTEEQLFDEQLKTIIFTYSLKPGEKQPITRQELLVTPDVGSNKVTSIYIDYSIETRDSSLQKKLLWQPDRSFQVTTIRQYPGQQEKVLTTKVTWNEPFE